MSSRLAGLAAAIVFAGGSAAGDAGRPPGAAAAEAGAATPCLERPIVVVYLDRLQDRVMKYWVVPEDSLLNQTVVVRFRLAADGSFTRTELVSATSSRIANSVELAIRYAGPFGLIPDGARCLVGRSIEMQFENPY